MPMVVAWTIATVALMLPLALALAALVRGNVPERLAAVQLAGTLAVLALAAADYALDQPAAIDIPLALALLSLPGTLLFAVFQERWL